MKKQIAALIVLLALACCGGADAATLKLPAGLRTLSTQAFAGDQALGEVVLPDGLVEIEGQAFANSSLAKINLPASLERIAADALSGCPANLTVTAEAGSYA